MSAGGGLSESCLGGRVDQKIQKMQKINKNQSKMQKNKRSDAEIHFQPNKPEMYWRLYFRITPLAFLHFCLAFMCFLYFLHFLLVHVCGTKTNDFVISHPESIRQYRAFVQPRAFFQPNTTAERKTIMCDYQPMPRVGQPKAHVNK